MFEREAKEKIACLVSNFLGGQRDIGSKKVALDLIVDELSKRPCIDEAKLSDRLRLAEIGSRDRYIFAERILIPDIRAGKFDGEPERPKEKKPPLSSKNLFEALRTLNVRDDNEDGYGYERIDYYLNAAWSLSEITIEEIHKFTGGMIVWVEAKAEWRKASKILQLCKMSKILGARISPEAAMAQVEKDVAEDKQLNKEIDGI